MYLHYASKLLSKIHHAVDMSQMLAEHLNHYTMMYGLNSNNLKEKVVGWRSAKWRPWQVVSAISMLLVPEMREPRATPELVSMPKKYQ